MPKGDGPIEEPRSKGRGFLLPRKLPPKTLDRDIYRDIYLGHQELEAGMMAKMGTSEYNAKIRRAIADRAAREEREAQEEADGTAERRSQAIAMADAECLVGEQAYRASTECTIRASQEWEALPQQHIGRRIFEAGLRNDLLGCQMETDGCLQDMMLLHHDLYGI